MPEDRRPSRRSQHPSGRRPPRRTLAFTAAALLVAATLLRAAALWAVPGAFATDPDGYRAIADNLRRHGTFALTDDIPTAYRPPLYPWIVAACGAVEPGGRVALGLVHLLAGVLTVWLTFRLAQRLRLGRWAPVAAFLIAADPILLAQSRLVMTETLATLLAVGSLHAIAVLATGPRMDRALMAGVCLGLASLCRPTFLPWAAICCLAVPPAVAVRDRFRPAAAMAMAMAGGVLLCLLPWVVRNAIQFGRPIVTTTHGGYTLLLGNNALFYRHLRNDANDAVWTADALQRELTVEPPFADPEEELEADRLLEKRAWSEIASHPGDFVRACVYRVRRLWGVLPRAVDPTESMGRRAGRFAVAVGYAIELPLAAIGLVVAWPWRRARLAIGSVRTGEETTVALGQGARGQSHFRRTKIGTVPHLFLPPVLRRRTAVWTAGLLLAACFTTIHALYWTDLRMRAPLMPAVALAAVAALAALPSRRTQGAENEPAAAVRPFACGWPRLRTTDRAPKPPG